MSEAEMQSFLARLYIDEPYRRLFYIDPDPLFADYKLSPREIRAIKKINRKMLNYFAQSLFKINCFQFEKAYAHTRNVMGQDFDLYLKRFNQLTIPDSQEVIIERILRFGRFLEQIIETDIDFPLYYSDLVRYERIFYEIQFPVDTSAKNNDARLTLNSYPKLCQGVKRITFSCNILQIVKEIQQKQTISSPPNEPHFFIFQPPSTSNEPKIFQIPKATNNLIGLSDGLTTIQEIINIVQIDEQEMIIQKQIVNAFEKLSKLKILEF